MIQLKKIFFILLSLTLLIACRNNVLVGVNADKTNKFINKIENIRIQQLDLNPGAIRCGEYYRGEIKDTAKFILKSLEKSCDEYVKKLFLAAQKEFWMRGVSILDFKDKHVWVNYKHAE